MRQCKYPYGSFLFVVLFIFGLAGCLSVSNSPSARFYALTVVEDDQGVQKYNISSDMIIGFGPLSIPQYLSRPQIVLRDKNNLLSFAQFDRWGEPLDLALESLISRDLEIMLPGAIVESYPWNPAVPVKYQVIVDVTSLETRIDQDMYMSAQWSLIDVASAKLLSIKRSEFRQPVDPHSYAGVAKTLSHQAVLLAGQIAQEISILEVKPPDSGADNKGSAQGE